MSKGRKLLKRIGSLISKNEPNNIQLVDGIIHRDLTITPIDEWESLSEEERDEISEKHARKRGS